MDKELRAIRFADTLDPRSLNRGDLDDPRIREAVQPAVDEMVEVGNSAVRELQRRVEDPEIRSQLKWRDLVEGVDKMVKLSRLIEGKSTGKVEVTASRMLDKLEGAGENDGPVVYNEGEYE